MTMEISKNDNALQERADKYIGHAYELGEDPETTRGRDGYLHGIRDQIEIDTEEMRRLNEEWEKNLSIQRAMLIDKACAWLNAHNETSPTGGDGVDIESFRKDMENKYFKIK